MKTHRLFADRLRKEQEHRQLAYQAAILARDIEATRQQPKRDVPVVEVKWDAMVTGFMDNSIEVK